MRVLRLLVTTTALLSLVACGFSLRGASLLPASMTRVYLQAADLNSVLIQKLENELRYAGAELTGNPAEASAVLRIIDDNADERVLSVSALGQPQEYELYHTVSFEMYSQTGPLLEPITLTLTRDYFFDEQDILGKSEDAAYLSEALAEDVARTIVRRAALVTSAKKQ